MTYAFFPLLIVFGSLGVVIFIILRKFPELSLLDPDSLPEAREAKLKESVIKKRLDESAATASTERAKVFAPFLKKIGTLEASLKEALAQAERTVVKAKDRALSPLNRQKRRLSSSTTAGTDSAQEIKNPESASARKIPDDMIRDLLTDGYSLLKKGEHDGAEQAFIEAIKLNPRQIEAYVGLGDVYAAENQSKEAIETYTYATKLGSTDESIFVRLADLYEKDGHYLEAIAELEKAVLANPQVSQRFCRLAELFIKVDEPETAYEALAQALDLEPQNPRYLDMIIETSIIIGDKERASEHLERLRMINPANQKIEIFRDKIAAIS